MLFDEQKLNKNKEKWKEVEPKMKHLESCSVNLNERLVIIEKDGSQRKKNRPKKKSK